MLYIYRTECHSAIKKKTDIMKLSGKRMKLGKIFLTEEIQYIFSYMQILAFKSMMTKQFVESQRLDIK